ncbi:MAG: quinohemoprotein amine dehydrogenase subunit gamma [Planctomycetota bacterium]
MKHLKAINRKAKRLESWALDAKGTVRGMAEDETPFGCTTIFGPGWEVDSSGGTYGLCQPIERDLYDCYHSCYWPAQVPDGLTNWPAWAETCGAPMNDWKSIDLVFP